MMPLRPIEALFRCLVKLYECREPGTIRAQFVGLAAEIPELRVATAATAGNYTLFVQRFSRPSPLLTPKNGQAKVLSSDELGRMLAAIETHR